MGSAGQPSLQTLDYVVFCAVLIISMAIGIRYAVAGQRSTSKETYFVGDRKMHYIPVALSLMVTFESSITMLGLPAEVYIYGTGVVLIALANLVVNVLIAYVSVPLFKPMNITSVFEYLQMRYNSRRIRTVGVCLSMFSYLFYLSIVLYAQAVALEAVVGLNMWLSILAMDACAVIYTSLGGIKSVVWADVFQAAVMFTGIFAVIIKGTIETGGTSKVWEYTRAGNRLNLPGMILICAPICLFIYLLVLYEGMVVYAFFSQRRIEPLSCGLITSSNQILPFAVLVLFENLPGMTGLFMASLFSGSLSTISSGFSSISIILIEDLLQPLLKHTSDARATLYAKISVVFLGVACILLCVIVTYVEGPLLQITYGLLSAAGGPLGGIFILACFFPSATSKGAFVGLLFGFAMSCSLSFGGNFSPNVRRTKWLSLGNGTCGDDDAVSNVTSVILDVISNATSTTPAYDTIANSTKSYNEFFSLSYCLWGPLAVVTTVSVGLIASYILGRNRPGDVNPKYFLEISDSLFFFLPSRLRRWLKHFGSQFKKGWKKSPEVDGATEIIPVSKLSPDQEEDKCSKELL